MQGAEARTIRPRDIPERPSPPRPCLTFSLSLRAPSLPHLASPSTLRFPPLSSHDRHLFPQWPILLLAPSLQLKTPVWPKTHWLTLKVSATYSSTSHTSYIAPRLVWTMLLLGRNITVYRLDQPFLCVPLLYLRIRLYYYSPFYNFPIGLFYQTSLHPFATLFCCCKFVVFMVLVLAGQNIVGVWGPEVVILFAWALSVPNYHPPPCTLSLKRRREPWRQHPGFYALFLSSLAGIRRILIWRTTYSRNICVQRLFEIDTPFKTTADKYRAPKGGGKILAQGTVWGCVADWLPTAPTSKRCLPRQSIALMTRPIQAPI